MLNVMLSDTGIALSSAARLCFEAQLCTGRYAAGTAVPTLQLPCCVAALLWQARPERIQRRVSTVLHYGHPVIGNTDTIEQTSSALNASIPCQQGL